MHYPNSIEDICYDPEHIKAVFSEIKGNFYAYWNDFIRSYSVIKIDIQKLAEHFGTDTPERKKKDCEVILKNIITEGIKDFENDRLKYLDILDPDSLLEYKDDPSYFKNTVLRNQCPIIHFTLANKSAKELDKYRKDFNLATANELLNVTTNLTNFANDYYKSVYNEAEYESYDDLKSLKLGDLQKEDYVVFGVIGGGIKSHFLYKMYPSVFPNRSRSAIWALYYLTNKKKFLCKQDSEFLMINTKYCTTQQNYFYPYDLFSYYAYRLYLLIKSEIKNEGISLSSEYRYVIVDSFLSFVQEKHSSEISLLAKNIEEASYGY